VNNVNEGSINLASNACSQISGNARAFNTSDVTFATPVVITSITVFETAGNVQAASQGYLWIGVKTGPFPTVPSDSLYNAAHLVPIVVTSGTVNGVANVVSVKANVNRPLPAGDYWIALAPRQNLGVFPYNVHLVTFSPVVGSPTRVIDACTVNTTWTTPLESAYPGGLDYSILVQGDLPVPAISSTWGRLKAFYQ
jgi:hypothetical protein